MCEKFCLYRLELLESVSSLPTINTVYTHQYPWSWYCLSSSMGGCAPYTSLAGMFKSSTNITHLLPICGPNTPFLRLSNLDIIMFWNRKILFCYWWYNLPVNFIWSCLSFMWGRNCKTICEENVKKFRKLHNVK